MVIRQVFGFVCAMITCVALTGCGGGGSVEPEPSTGGAQEQASPQDSPEKALEEGGADAALPADQKAGEEG